MVVTHAGTKPGDPLADLIFCVAFFQYQQELKQALLDEGLLIHLPRPGPFSLESCDDLVESIAFGTPAFFDDFFVPLVYDSPAGLLEDIQMTVACLISVGHRFGISINTSEGKTEAMIHLVGPTARDTLSALFTTRHPDAPPHLLGLLELHQGQHIGLVSSYKRLGMRKQFPQCIPRERRRANTGLLRQGTHSGLFRPGSLPRAVSARRTHGAYMAPFRRIVSTRFALDIAQAVHRLLHLARVLQHGPDWLWSLIQSQAGRQWREYVFLDLEFMAAVLHDKLADLGDPRGQWQKMASVHPWHSCCLEASCEVLLCCRTLSSPAGPLVSCVLALL